MDYKILCLHEKYIWTINYVVLTFFCYVLFLLAGSSDGASTQQEELTTCARQRRTSPPLQGSKGSETKRLRVSRLTLFCCTFVAPPSAKVATLGMQRGDRPTNSRAHHLFGDPTTDVLIGQVMY